MYVPITCLTHGSPLLSQTTPEALIAFCKDQNYLSVGLSDYDQLYMCVQYYEEATSAGIKPLLGLKLQIYGNDEKGYISLIAKNKKGWQDLLYLVYLANQNFKDKPRLELFTFFQNVTPDITVITSCFLDLFERFLPTAYYGVNLIENERVECNLKPVAITPNHYLEAKDWLLNKYLLCNYLKASFKTARHPLFNDNRYFIPSEVELLKWGYTQAEIDNTGEIYEQVEHFDILYKQELPHYPCPSGMDEDSYLLDLCRKGYKRLGLKKDDQVYIDRIKNELKVIGEAGMSGYFLIMQDIIQWAKSQNILVGVGRGSAAGCLVSYLTGITSVDPIKYGLSFERFYSPDRKGQLIDVDTDFPPSRREEVIQYIQNKYGAERFAQLSTFSTLKGPAALKAALRAAGSDASERDYITKKMPPEGKIAPYLQKQYDEVGSKSMVLWCINHIDEFNQWCSPKFQGVYASEFQAAIQLDQTITGRGRHASAYALANIPIYKRAPYIWDESAERYVVGLNMDDAEKLGFVKLDLLGVSLLDKADLVRKVLKNGAF